VPILETTPTGTAGHPLRQAQRRRVGRDWREGEKAMSNQAANHGRAAQVEEILELARRAGLLITLDGQIGREKYQSVAGSLTAFLRFVEAVRAGVASSEPA
jgi:hypothetical protein